MSATDADLSIQKYHNLDLIAFFERDIDKQHIYAHKEFYTDQNG